MSLGFIGVQLSQAAPWNLADAHWPGLALSAVLGACGYALTGFLLAEAWRQLLGTTAEHSPARCHYAVYGRTQIVKYLPGNVFHFAGRQIMGRQLGHQQATLALASISEVLLLLLVAAALAAPLAPRWLSLDPAVAWTAAALAIAIAAMLTIRFLIPAAPRSDRCYGESTPTCYSESTPSPPFPVEGEGVRLTPRFPFEGEGVRLATCLEPSLPPCGGGSGWGVRFDRWRALIARITPIRIGRAALLYAAFFVIGGVLLWLLTLSAGDRGGGTQGLLISISTLALAWMAGFVTPGSSAGFGVREAVLIMVLQSSLDGEGAVLVALAMRLVTLAGDLLFFAACLALPLPHAQSSAALQGSVEKNNKQHLA